MDEREKNHFGTGIDDSADLRIFRGDAFGTCGRYRAGLISRDGGFIDGSRGRTEAGESGDFN